MLCCRNMQRSRHKSSWRRKRFGNLRRQKLNATLKRLCERRDSCNSGRLYELANFELVNILHCVSKVLGHQTLLQCVCAEDNCYSVVPSFRAKRAQNMTRAVCFGGNM